MHLKTIHMELARNPGDHSADALRAHRYVLTAPLTSDGHLDHDVWKRNKEACVFTHYVDGEVERHGRLSHLGGGWRLHPPGEAPSEDEKFYKLDQHQLLEGEYLTLSEPDGEALTYRIARITRGPEAG